MKISTYSRLKLLNSNLKTEFQLDYLLQLDLENNRNFYDFFKNIGTLFKHDFTDNKHDFNR